MYSFSRHFGSAGQPFAIAPWEWGNSTRARAPKRGLLPKNCAHPTSVTVANGSKRHTRKVNVGLVAATNRDLEKMVAEREFRSDLFYRLNVFPIRIPPLRERKDDIPLLVSFFVQKFAKQMQKEIESVHSGVMKGLTAWEWPGNIRELENFIERAVILTRGKALEVPLTELRKAETEKATDAVVVKKKPTARKANSSRPDINAGAEEYEKRQRDEIIQALAACKGRIGGTDGAAVRLNINRTTLMYRMRKLGIYAKLYS